MNPNAQAAGRDKNPLGTQPVGRLLLKYAIPSVISMLVMSIYNIVDQIFIGNSAAGYLGNGATTVAFPLVTVMTAIALLIGNGASAFINLQMGKGNYDVARRTVGTSLVFMTGIGVVLGAVVLVFLEPILYVLGATDLVMPYAIDYTSVLVMGAPFAMITTGLTHVIRADGSPRYSMFASMTGALLNIVLDPIFIFPWGLDMGVRGAALATILSQMLSAVITVYYLFRKARHTQVDRSSLRVDFGILRKVFAFGSSSFATQMAITIVNVTLNNSLRYYGGLSAYGSEVPLSSMGIVMKINAILLSLILGLVIGAQPLLGFNYGAGNYKRVQKTYRLVVTSSTLIAGVVNLLFLITPGTFISIFGNQTEFAEFGSMALRIYMGAVVCAGIQIPSANYFQAVGKPLKAMTLSMTRQLFLLVPAILILPLFFGIYGVLYAGPVADLGALIITSFFIIGEMRQLSAMAATRPTDSAVEPTTGEC